MDNIQVPRTKYAHYSRRELLDMYDKYKTDADYVEELKQRLERLPS